MEKLLAASDRINVVLDRVAMAVGWLFLVLTAVIVFDVLSRKWGFQLPGMGSTRLQELEWHLHTALFSFWVMCASAPWSAPTCSARPPCGALPLNSAAAPPCEASCLSLSWLTVPA